jgi:hypothetical protein
MIFIWPFLPLFRPLKRHNGQIFLGLPDLTIVQNPHAQCANHETHSVMQHTGYRPFCPFCCQNLGKPSFIIQFGMSLQSELLLYSHRMETWHTISQNEAHLYFHLTCKDHKLLGKTVRMLTKYMIIAEMHLSPTHSHNGNKHSVIKTF